MRAAVAGHVEWVTFARVERLPRAGEIIHADDVLELPAGGGPVAAVQLAKLAGNCTLYTALGDDELGRRARGELQALGVRVEAVFRPEPQRRAFTFVDAAGERTITVIGPRLEPLGADPLPWGRLAEADAVYFCAGDVTALDAARRGKALVASARELRTLARAGVELDALIGSDEDPSESYPPGSIAPPPRLVVRTAGERGGGYETAGGESGSYPATPLPGPRVDAYGCGDSFAAGLTYGLAADLPLTDALRLAARCGAACLTAPGPFAGQLTADDV